MKKEYSMPETDILRMIRLERSFLTGSELDSLEEKNDLEGFDWNYN